MKLDPNCIAAGHLYFKMFLAPGSLMTSCWILA